jgi:hypothetical protein
MEWLTVGIPAVKSSLYIMEKLVTYLSVLNNQKDILLHNVICNLFESGMVGLASCYNQVTRVSSPTIAIVSKWTTHVNF